MDCVGPPAMTGCAAGRRGMRRALSIVLFVIGGFCVGMQVMIAS
jgi:hypothetical protein